MSRASSGTPWQRSPTSEQLRDADLAIVVNPNNPDGRLVGKDALLAVADDLRPRGGLLMVDEAFMDVGPAGASLVDEVARGNIVVLRSFGKFFGLAGLRLGFALAAPEIAARLNALLGPWAVSGPAIAIGETALADLSWAAATRARLGRGAGRLDEIIDEGRARRRRRDVIVPAGANPSSGDLFHHLGRAGILVRRFAEQPTWLRFGLPDDEDVWVRLRTALAAFQQ